MKTMQKEILKNTLSKSVWNPKKILNYPTGRQEKRNRERKMRNKTENK